MEIDITNQINNNTNYLIKEHRSKPSIFSKILPFNLFNKINHVIHAVLIPTTTENLSTLDKINAILNPNNCSNKLTKFKELYKFIEQTTLNREEQIWTYESLVQAFNKIKHTNSQSAWVQRADLLDALDTLIEKYVKTNIGKSPFRPIEVTFNLPTEWKEHSVPLVLYSQVKDATNAIHRLGVNTLKTYNAEDLKNDSTLRPYIVEEYTETAKLIHYLTKRGFPAAELLNAFFNLVTRLLGKLHNRKTTIKTISKVSQDLGIKSFEILCKKIVQEDGSKEVKFFYRGPKYLFGQTVHDYKTVNDWFTRDLTEKARSKYLAKTKFKESKLQKRYGDFNGVSQIVISNGHCRLRFHTIEKGHFGDLQEITGKALNQGAEKEAKIKGDSSYYYKEKYKFSPYNLLGFESQASMEPLPLSDKQKAKLNKHIDHLQTLADQKTKLNEQLTTSHPKKQTAIKKKIEKIEISRQKLQKKILSDSNTQSLLDDTLHELLSAIFRAFNRESCTQVIQRLATEDIHIFAATVNGTPLSHLEAVQILQNELNDLKNYLNIYSEHLDSFQMKAFEKEIEHLEELQDILKKQELLLDRASQSTIDILGTTQSVSTPAIANQSRILAQNSRKVMLFKHKDGSFSLHTFIGAVGVDKVDTQPQTQFQVQGSFKGKMAFGPDIYERVKNFFSTKASTTRDGLKKLRIKKSDPSQCQAGKNLGHFPINGSTVISHYFSRDLRILDKIKKYNNVAAYGEGVNRANIEIKANLGDSILIKTEIVLGDFIVKHFLKNASSSYLDQSVSKILEETIKNPPNNLSIEDKEILTELKRLNAPRLTFSDYKLKQNLEKLIRKRLAVIQAEKEQFNFNFSPQISERTKKFDI